MNSTFDKNYFNEDFDYKSGIENEFAKLGFTNIRVQSSFANGASHYVTVDVNVLNEGMMPACVYVENGVAMITVRISDHDSNLSRYGVSGNNMTMFIFKKLIAEKVISA